MIAKSAPETERYQETPEKNLLREQLVAAFGASIDGIAVLSSEERFIYANEAHARIYGFSKPDDLIGLSWQALYDRQELERFQKWIMPLFFQKGHWRGEAVGRKNDGTHFPQEVSLSVVRGGGLVCVVRDITERKKLDEKRSVIIDISRSLGESMDYSDTVDRISKVAVPAFCDYCVLNLAGMHQFIEQCRVVGTRPQDEPTIQQLAKHAFCRGADGPCLVSRVGEREPSSVLTSLGVESYIFIPLRARGALIGSLAFLRTAQHPLGAFDELEYDAAVGIGAKSALAIENSRLYVEAREAVRLQESLMTAASHDLKNPLMAIGINVEILERLSQNRPIEPQLRGIAHNIKVSVDQMSSLVGQLLEYEKLRNGRLALTKRTVRTLDLFEQLTALFGPVSERRAIQLELRIDPMIGRLNCDGEKIVRVLSNLIGNAFKFTSPGGKVLVQVLPTDDQAVFKVSDTGIGIRPEDLEHVFELHWKSSDSPQGTGLGLTIAKSIVEAHGGRIWAESQPGVGSTFSFSIPSSEPVTSAQH